MKRTGRSATSVQARRAALAASAVLLLGACGSGGSSEDLATIKEARSIAAEWALVNRQAESGRLRPAYVDAMREESASQIEAALGSMKDRGSAAAREMEELTRLPPDSPSATISGHARRLEAIEDGLEAH